MNTQVIPLYGSPGQTFTTTLVIDGVNRALQFKISYNETAGYWIMNISDPATGSDILTSVPLLSAPDGESLNLLEQYRHLGIGSAYLVNVSNIADEQPTDENLGTDFILVWGDTPDA